MKWEQINYWNSQSYGSAKKINGWYLILIISFFCMITPCTNWIIPIVIKKVPKKIIWRF